MKRLFLCLSAAATLSVVAPVTSVFGQRSYDDRIDIAGLLAEAARTFDTAQDVIILSDGQSVTRYADGRFATTVHRILWINSYLAVDDCGDVRVPFDYDHCSFAPLAVRTWRDGQWWPSDSSGVVETLPFEVEKAYDYAGMREMMLLLSGTGVPCIIEVAYRIEDRTLFRTNWDGLWLFARPDPAVESWFEFRAPPGSELGVTLSEGEIAREVSSDPQSGMESSVWRMRHVPAQPDPHSADPAADAPHLVWSTWESWNDLGKMITDALSAELPADSPLRAAVDSLSVEARTPDEKLQMIADFVDDRVSYVDYPADYWWTDPREGDRTYATAYGHRLDRAVLAAALFRLTGMPVEPLFVSNSLTPIETKVASLARFNGLSLRIQGEGISAVYDPSDGAISRGNAGLYGRTTWLPSTDSGPHKMEPAKGDLNVRIDLQFDKEKSHWTGDGFFAADGGLCPFDHMTGLEGNGEEYLGSVVESFIENASVSDFSPEQIDEAGVAVGFTITLDSAEVDDSKRTVLSIGEPKDGIINRLSGQAAELYRTEMRSTTHLPGLLSQRVECRIDTAGFQVVYRPEEFSIKNSAGSFSVTTTTVHGKLVVMRELHLEKAEFRPSEWPALRELLLAETQLRHGQVILKARDEVTP